MPLYTYQCEKCGTTVEELIRTTTGQSSYESKMICPHCESIGIMIRIIDLPGKSGSDSKMTPDSVTGGKWSELMSRMKSRGAGIDNAAKDNLDRASSQTGRRWHG